MYLNTLYYIGVFVDGDGVVEKVSIFSSRNLQGERSIIKRHNVVLCGHKWWVPL